MYRVELKAFILPPQVKHPSYLVKFLMYRVELKVQDYYEKQVKTYALFLMYRVELKDAFPQVLLLLSPHLFLMYRVELKGR